MEIISYAIIATCFFLFVLHVRREDKALLDDLDRLEKQVDEFVEQHERRNERIASMLSELSELNSSL